MLVLLSYLRRFAICGVSMTVLFTMSTSAFAAGSGMPWEAPLTQILESIEGPVARIVAVIIIVITGLSLAFGETSGGFRRLVQIVFGLSIAFAATSFFLSFFSFAGERSSDGNHGISCAVASVANHANPDGRRAANRCDIHRHTRSSPRPRAPALDCGRNRLGDRTRGSCLRRAP